MNRHTAGTRKSGRKESAFDGLPVTEIGAGAFSRCKRLEAIRLPETLQTIEMLTFYLCESLREITVPASVTAIKSCAFDWCSSLAAITIENPDCEIFDAGRTISNGCRKQIDYFNGTIYGHAGSTAQAYAQKYGNPFACRR